MSFKQITLLVVLLILSFLSVVNAQWGHALHFNWEERDRAEVLDAPYIWPAQMPTGTIELWFKPDTILAWNTHDPNYTFLFSKNISGNNFGDVGADWQEGDGRLHWFIENGDVRSSCYSDSTIIPYFEPRWYHFAGTWDVNSGMRLFIDGVMHPEMGSTEALPVTTGEQIFVIGDGSIDHFEDRYETFRGSIDEFRISSVVRYTEDFDIPPAPFEVDINTLALWHFDEGQGDFAFDVTGNGFNAHLGGMNEPGPFPTVDTVLTKPDWVVVQETNVARKDEASQIDFSLTQNYPNPFNANTRIIYSVIKQSYVNLSIYDMVGKNIVTLVNTNQKNGLHSVLWDGRNREGRIVSSGVYLYRLKSNHFVESKKMIFIQ